MAPYHCEQSHAHWCVPACCCIVLGHLGDPRCQQEAQLAQQLSVGRNGASLEEAAIHLGWQYLQIDADDPRSYEWLRARKDPLAILQVFGGPLTRALATRYPRLTSRFGPLCNDFSGPPLHAVVLRGADPRGVTIQDPYYPAAGQPLNLSNDEFVGAFQGALVLPSRRRRG